MTNTKGRINYSKLAKTKFKKMYKELPEQAKTELVIGIEYHPMTLNVCYLEIKNNTKLGKKILRLMGYAND